MKGQISIFMVLSLFIILAFVAMFNFSNGEMIDDNFDALKITMNSDILKLKENISSCLQDQFQRIVKVSMFQGGVYYSDLDSSEYYIQNTGAYSIPFYYDYGNLNFPDLGSIGVNLSKGIMVENEKCIIEEVRIESEKISALTVIDERGINCQLKFPVKFISNNKMVAMDDFVLYSDYNYSFYHNIGFDITNLQEKTNNFFCLTCLDDLSENKNISLSFKDWISENKVERMYNINDKFYFAHRINRSNDLSSDFVEIKNVDDFELVANYPFEYEFDYYGDNLNWSDSTGMFDVVDGKINFTPTVRNLGNHIIQVSANNSFGRDSILFKMNIVSLVSTPVLGYIGGYRVNVNDTLLFNLTVFSDQQVFYFDNTDLFNITSGMINYTAKDSDIGHHEINISVISNSGGMDSKIMYLDVT